MGRFKGAYPYFLSIFVLDMQKLLTFLRNRHEAIFRALLFIGAALIISLVLPKEGKFKYEYQKSRPWGHEDLVAPFGFAILKPKAEVEKELAAAKEAKKYYFKVDKSIAEKQKAVLETKLADEIRYPAFISLSENKKKQFLANNIEEGQQILDKVYSKGIIEVVSEVEKQNDEFDIYLLSDNNVEQSRDLGSFLTVSKAQQFIETELNQNAEKIDKSALRQLLTDAISQNVLFDKQMTQKVGENDLNNVSITRGAIAEGEKIIDKGDIVDDAKFQVLESLRTEYEKQLGSSGSSSLIFLGHFILSAIVLLVLYIFIILFRPHIAQNNLYVVFILLMVLLMVISASVVHHFTVLHPYVVPFCILPIIIRAFFDTRLALFTHLVTTLIIGYIVPNGFQFVFLQLLAGIISIFSYVNMQQRSQLFIIIAIIFATYSVSYFGIAIIQEGDIQSINLSYFAYFAASVGLTLFVYPLIYVLEKIFGFVSDVTMLELSNTNSTLLRELAVKAPGTFQHSMQVANLAESAIFAIEGNPMLMRTGALYHDIGKMEMPMYFVENQVSGVNPHDELSFEESARIIISHVGRGVEMAKKHKLPEQIIDFIRTHHGTSVVRYFYHSHLKNYPEGEIDKEAFSYPGPLPFSKETAVLMMADTVEAASRTMKEHSPEKISELVDRLIDHQVEENQFVNSNITFRDITVIRKIFKKKLAEIYHARIEYPS